MGPFHVVQLAGDGLDDVERAQLEVLGHRGRHCDPLYGTRRTLHTDENFLTDK